MLNKVIALFGGKGKLIGSSIAGVALVGTLFYGHMKIDNLESTVELRQQRIDYVENEYESLRSQYSTLETDFKDFIIRVQNDMDKQEAIVSDIRATNNEYRQRVLDLEQRFMFNDEGERRDWDSIFDDNIRELEDVINQNTEDLKNEFENTTGSE